MEDVLGRTRDDSGGHWVFRFANGLVVHTDPFWKADGARILQLEHLGGRKSELTPAQVEPMAFDDYCEAYGKCFPDQAVDRR